MLTLGDLSEKGVLTITASGHLSKEDLDGITPQLAELLDRHGRLRFYVELRDVTGFGLGALWEDLKFDLQHRHQYDRTAIVGDMTWQKAASRLAGPFFGAEVRFFEADQREAAWAWVNE
jgi:hypothetical protein